MYASACTYSLKIRAKSHCYYIVSALRVCIRVGVHVCVCVCVYFYMSLPGRAVATRNVRLERSRAHRDLYTHTTDLSLSACSKKNFLHAPLHCNGHSSAVIA